MTDVRAAPLPPETKRTASSFLLGIVFILSGTFAILMPVLSTLALTVVIGVALAFSGVSQMVYGFGRSGWDRILNLLLGALYLACGLVFWLDPRSAAMILTLLLSALLVTQGLGEIVMGMKMRQSRTWGWLVLSGLIAIAAGIWLILRMPIAGYFAPGTILGIALLFEGWAFIMTGSSTSAWARPAKAA
ncbi:HdeD family acid-resistance protein [Sphingosinicella terrae]|uniref:HdeD family acid-resistance protein n=1 Tax=Sphingosinicella terrae TaxID=2172047 RepID=UPI000E0DD6AF|nr:DUF308 domain-containing protein [Sphingosinicella terrae]